MSYFVPHSMFRYTHIIFFSWLYTIQFWVTHSLQHRLDPDFIQAHPDYSIELSGPNDEILVTITEQPSVGIFWELRTFPSDILTVLEDDSVPIFPPTHTPSTPQDEVIVGSLMRRTVRLVGMKNTPAHDQVLVELMHHQGWHTTPEQREGQPSLAFRVRATQPHDSSKSLRRGGYSISGSSDDKFVDSTRMLRGAQQVDSWTLPAEFPTVLDPRSSPYFPAVRDQGSCGACWAFATVGQLEVMYALKCNVSAPDLSEQFLISCNARGYSCRGGSWAHYYHYNTIVPLESEAGAVLESDFPYMQSEGQCNRHPLRHPLKLDGDRIKINNTVESIVTHLVSHGAVGAFLCMSQAMTAWKPNASVPVFTGPSCTTVNHAVVIVGYNAPQQYWIIRNSYGPKWGAGGYLYLQWGVGGIAYTNVVDFSDCSSALTGTPTPSATPSPFPSMTITTTTNPTPATATPTPAPQLLPDVLQPQPPSTSTTVEICGGDTPSAPAVQIPSGGTLVLRLVCADGGGPMQLTAPNALLTFNPGSRVDVLEVALQANQPTPRATQCSWASNVIIDFASPPTNSGTVRVLQCDTLTSSPLTPTSGSPLVTGCSSTCLCSSQFDSSNVLSVKVTCQTTDAAPPSPSSLLPITLQVSSAASTAGVDATLIGGIAGGVVGAVLLAIIVGVLFVRFHSHKTAHSDVTDHKAMDLEQQQPPKDPSERPFHFVAAGPLGLGTLPPPPPTPTSQFAVLPAISPMTVPYTPFNSAAKIV